MKRFIYKLLGRKNLTYDDVKHSISNMIKQNKSLEDIEVFIEKLCSKTPKHCIKYKRAFFVQMKDIAPKVAVLYGEDIVKHDDSDRSFIKILATRYKRIGNLEEYDRLMKKYFSSEPSPNQEDKEKVHLINSNKKTRKLKTIKKRILKFVKEERKFQSIEKYIDMKILEHPEYEIDIRKISFSLLKDIYTEDVIKYGEFVISSKQADDKFIKVFYKRASIVKESIKTLFTLPDKFILKEFKEKLLELSKTQEVDVIKEYIDSNISKFSKKILLISKTSFSVLKDSHTELSLKYIDNVISEEKEIPFLRVVVKRTIWTNDIKLIDKYASLLYELTQEKTILEHVIYAKNSNIFNSLELEINNKEEFSSILDDFVMKNLNYKHQIYSLITDIFTKNDLVDEAILYAKKSLEFGENDEVSLKLFGLQIKKGVLLDAIKDAPLVEKVEDPRLKSRLHAWKGNVELLDNGFKFPVYNKDLNYKPTNKALYLLYNSLPYHSGGYATRAQGLMEGVISSNQFEVEAVSRLAYPQDILKLKTDESVPTSEYVDDILYHRLKTDSKRVAMTYEEYTKEYAEAVIEIAKIEKPFVIHAASNFYNGLAAVYAAKKLGIKSIYEIRGLWEITRISREPEWEITAAFELNKNMETEAALNADIVITITQALKDEMVRRGVPAEKIEILPNGVVTDRFKPLKKDDKLAKELNIDNKKVIGFIGSFVQYEGLEYIVDAVEILVKKGQTNLIALMVGDGAVWQDIKDRVEQKGLDTYFIFTGRIPHEDVESYYSLVDIAPLPRKGQPVCEMVSPLKPFEAMAMEKVVLSSNVAALAEIVKDGYNGMLFEKDNVEDFAKKLEILINNEELRKKLGKQAREWVLKERDWKVLSKKLIKIYSELYHEK